MITDDILFGKAVEQPRELTEEEIRDKFLEGIRGLVIYWSKESRALSVKEKMEGLIHSVLVLLDGGSMGSPGFLLVPAPHPYDKDFGMARKRNWYPENRELDSQLKGQIAGVLHDRWARMSRESKEGK